MTGKRAPPFGARIFIWLSKVTAIRKMKILSHQFSLNRTGEDSKAVLGSRVLVEFASPERDVRLVGHSYGGNVITSAGIDERVVGLVYICALAPDADETLQAQQFNFT